MTFEEFRRHLKRRFSFQGDKVKAKRGAVLAFVGPAGTRTELAAFNGATITQPEAHFAATAVMDAPGPDEIVHITEPGRYFDHVYRGDHEKLYSLDDLDDPKALARLGLKAAAYAKLTRTKRIEAMPFFTRKPLAKTLQGFFNGIQIVELTPAAAKPISRYLVSKARTFYLVSTNDTWLVIRTGKVGTAGRIASKKFGSKVAAHTKATALVTELLAKGFRDG